jgi:hypothetical protein
VDEKAKAHFINCYTRILAKAWCDDGFVGRLTTDSVAILAANGLRLRSDAHVAVTRPISEPDVRMQLALWEDAEWSGNYVLQVPTLGVRDLTEAELDNLSGGVACLCCWCIQMH